MNNLQKQIISECQFDFVHAAGPGGQNVNKVASAAQLKFDIVNSPSLSDAQKQRLSRLAGKRVAEDGVLTIEARRYRERERNRLDAIARLLNLVEQALVPPKKRLPSRPTPAAVQKRLTAKKKHGELKRGRRANHSPDEE